jgi:thymidylate synthase ThyX
VDNCRFLLPASALANVGLTANARVLEHAIRKMLSHPLAEAREIGLELKRVAQGETPTLVKYADEVPYARETALALGKAAQAIPARAEPNARETILLDCDPVAEDKFLAACLARYGEAAYHDYLVAVRAMPPEQKAALAREALGRLGQYDIPLRELEHVTYTFETTMDQGAYFEIKRHRMMTQSPQRLTTRLGYATPRAMVEAGCGDDYAAAMRAAAQTYEALVGEFPEEASYVVPNGFNRRLVMTLNLRQAFHLCELRGAANAHFSVRRLAGQLYAALAQIHPLLTPFMRCQGHATAEALEAEYFETMRGGEISAP